MLCCLYAGASCIGRAGAAPGPAKPLAPRLPLHTLAPPSHFLCPLPHAARRARALAREEGEKALAALDCLPDSPSKQSLHQMVDYVLERLY